MQDVLIAAALCLGLACAANDKRATLHAVTTEDPYSKTSEVVTTSWPPPDSREGDACGMLGDGQHQFHTPDGELAVVRTCVGGETVGFCDVEVTRLKRTLSLESCESVRRVMGVRDGFEMNGTLDVRVGGVLGGIELGAIMVAGKATVGPTFKVKPWLSGPFEPKPDDRFVVLHAHELDYRGPTGAVRTPRGGSFEIEITETDVVLTRYRPPADGWTYTPVQVMP
ncbi:MAG: hypothetical protein AAFQ65_06335 [Myxococcota bacterium]